MQFASRLYHTQASDSFARLKRVVVQFPLNRNIEWKDPPRPQLHKRICIEGAESGGHYDEEITDHDRLAVVADKGQPPPLRVGFPASAPIFRINSWRSLDNRGRSSGLDL